MIVEPTDTTDLLKLIHSNNADLFPDQRKGWIITFFPFIQLHFVCKFLEVQFAKALEAVLWALLAHSSWDNIKQIFHMMRLCWLLCNFHAEVPGTLCAFGMPKLYKPHLRWWSTLKVFQHWHGRNLRMVRILLSQEEWSREGELGGRPASESWAAWSFLLPRSQQGHLMSQNWRHLNSFFSGNSSKPDCELGYGTVKDRLLSWTGISWAVFWTHVMKTHWQKSNLKL